MSHQVWIASCSSKAVISAVSELKKEKFIKTDLLLILSLARRLWQRNFVLKLNPCGLWKQTHETFWITKRCLEMMAYKDIGANLFLSVSPWVWSAHLHFQRCAAKWALFFLHLVRVEWRIWLGKLQETKKRRKKRSLAKKRSTPRCKIWWHITHLRSPLILHVSWHESIFTF